MTKAKFALKSTQGGRMARRTIVLEPHAIQAILRHYAARGSEAIPELSRRYGVCAYYIRDLASAHGVKVTGWRARGYDDSNDPRWAWARKRGAVIA